MDKGLAGQSSTGTSRRKKRRLPKTVSREEANAIFAACNLRSPTGLRDRCMLELMYRAGLRVGEVCNLEPRDVDGKGVVRIIDGKGGDGTAYFDAPSVTPLLEEWKRERKRLKVPAGAPLFCTLKGGKVSVRQVEAMVKRRARRAGVTAYVTPHVFRHSFATELLEEGFNIRQVQEAVRHRELETTMIYTHVYDAQLRNKIQRRAR